MLDRPYHHRGDFATLINVTNPYSVVDKNVSVASDNLRTQCRTYVPLTASEFSEVATARVMSAYTYRDYAEPKVVLER